MIGQLSKGYRQRVGLADALVARPEGLILDEPTDGLDPNQRRDMLRLIADLGKARTVVLSTHILPEVVATCQRVLIIAQGKVVADDTLQGLQKAHAGAATADGHTGPAPSLEEIFLKLTSA